MTALLFVFSIILGSQLDTGQVRELDLSGWVALAYQNSPAISSADASLLSAQASLTSSKSFLWPSLTMSAGASKIWSSAPMPGGGILDNETNSFSTSLSLSQ